MLYKNLLINIKEVDDTKYTIRAVFSTGDEDRHGEIVNQETWILDNFLKNPVVLFSHDKSQPAIGKVIELYFNEQGNLEGLIQFAVKEYDFAKTIYNLYKGKFMNAFSAGFLNQATEYDEENETVTLKKNELLEMSAVTIPANALALAKEKGIDTKSLEKRIKPQATITQETVESITKSIKELETLINTHQVVSNDTAVKSRKKTKVETPVSKGVSVKQIATKAINRATRSLLKEKRNLN